MFLLTVFLFSGITRMSTCTWAVNMTEHVRLSIWHFPLPEFHFMQNHGVSEMRYFRLQVDRLWKSFCSGLQGRYFHWAGVKIRAIWLVLTDTNTAKLMKCVKYCRFWIFFQLTLFCSFFSKHRPNRLCKIGNRFLTMSLLASPRFSCLKLPSLAVHFIM